MSKIMKIIGWFLALFVVIPITIGAAQGLARGWPASWRVADWSSSRLLPDAAALPDAQVIVLASRTGGWKSIFAEHMSIVVKSANAAHWTRYDVVGWGNPVRKDAYVADARWYGNPPRIIYQVRGPEAARLIPEIENAIARYPYGNRGSYTVWPGPNSNTFVAWVVRNSTGFNAELAPAAVGKDWLGPGLGLAVAPSKTGYSFSLAGWFGATAAWDEGLELNLLGSTIGLDVNDLAIKLPALGKLSLLPGS